MLFNKINSVHKIKLNLTIYYNFQVLQSLSVGEKFIYSKNSLKLGNNTYYTPNKKVETISCILRNNKGSKFQISKINY